MTAWREIRRARDVITKLDDANLLAISAACEAQDRAKFVDLMGGVFVKRDGQTVRPFMLLADKENQYSINFKQIKGVIMRGIVRVISRWHIWTIKKKEIEGGVFMYSDIEKAKMQTVGEKRPPLDLCQ